MGSEIKKNSLESQTAEASLVFLSLLVHVHPHVGGMCTTVCTSVHMDVRAYLVEMLSPSSLWLLGSEQAVRLGGSFSPGPPTGPVVPVYTIE